jgi:hypothetical protein
MFNYVEVRINKSELTVATINVPSWEVPVLAAVHGDDRVLPTGRLIPVHREKPAPQAEYDRLAFKYKSNRDKGGSDFVSEVYGVGAIGVRRLADEMRRVHEASTDTGPAGDLGDDLSFVLGESDPTAGMFDDAPAHAAGAQPIAE